MPRLFASRALARASLRFFAEMRTTVYAVLPDGHEAMPVPPPPVLGGVDGAGVAVAGGTLGGGVVGPAGPVGPVGPNGGAGAGVVGATPPGVAVSAGTVGSVFALATFAAFFCL